MLDAQTAPGRPNAPEGVGKTFNGSERTTFLQGQAMRTADECRAKAEEALAMAASSPQVADGYRAMAAEWMHLARTAEWQDRYEMLLEP